MKNLMLLAQLVISAVMFAAAVAWFVCHLINGSMSALGVVITLAVTALIGLLVHSSYRELRQTNR